MLSNQKKNLREYLAAAKKAQAKSC